MQDTACAAIRDTAVDLADHLGIDDGIGDLEADTLVFTDFLAESSSFVCIADSQIQRSPDPQAAGGGGQAFRNHHLVETEGAAVQIAHQVLFGHLHIPEYQPPGAAPSARGRGLSRTCVAGQPIRRAAGEAARGRPGRARNKAGGQQGVGLIQLVLATR